MTARYVIGVHDQDAPALESMLGGAVHLVGHSGRVVVPVASLDGATSADLAAFDARLRAGSGPVYHGGEAAAAPQLLPAESMAITVARAQLGRGDNPGLNVTAALLLTIDRLTGRADTDDELRRLRPGAGHLAGQLAGGPGGLDPAQVVRLSLARTAHRSAFVANRLRDGGRAAADPELIAYRVTANMLTEAAATISDAYETGQLPDPYQDTT